MAFPYGIELTQGHYWDEVHCFRLQCRGIHWAALRHRSTSSMSSVDPMIKCPGKRGNFTSSLYRGQERVAGSGSYWRYFATHNDASIDQYQSVRKESGVTPRLPDPSAS